MRIELSEELHRALQQGGGAPLEVVDPATNQTYMLIPREDFERMRPLLDNGALTLQEQRELLRRAGERAGWNDSEMHDVDRYDEIRGTRPPHSTL